MRLGDRWVYHTVYGFVVSRSLAHRCGLLFSRPMPLGIGYRLYGFIDASCNRVFGI